MNQMEFASERRVAHYRRLCLTIWLCLTALGAVGCEVDSFLDPSVVGRWERTPVVLPILGQLDIIDESSKAVEGLSQIQQEDLIPFVHEYMMGPGDIVAITVFELIQPSSDSVLVRRIDDLGMIRLPIVGAVKAAGMTPSGLEKGIAEILDVRGVLKDAIVSVIVQEGRQNTFSVIGDPRGAAVGTYLIPRNDFRFLDALALARGVSENIKTLYVIRQIPSVEATSDASPDGGDGDLGLSGETPRDPANLIEDLFNSMDKDFRSDGIAGPRGAGAPTDELLSTLDEGVGASLDRPSHWAYLNGRWVRVGNASPSGQQAHAAATQPGGVGPVVTQRVVEVPYDKLLDGEMRYNIVIRAGDVIRVPPVQFGNVYIGGAISRPGTYALPGEKDLTLKQLVFAAGNLSSLAIPERVDLIRRMDNDQEAVVRLNLRAIFEGTQPDFYLKPRDTINVGTSFAAVPLALLRNGLRVSYGFGFILDRNFSTDVFGPIQTDRN